MDEYALRDLFLKRLTIDSKHNDRRKTDYNQAIFDYDTGYQCFNGTDLIMVMEKFDLAVKDYLKPRIKK
jgi:predicted metal-dependent hydrolase